MSTLKAEIEAIEYEHWMLQATGTILRTTWTRLPVVERNAFVESHAIHLRNLLEFLCDPGKASNNKNMRAADAMYGAAWQQTWPPGAAKLYGRASEEIAHLSRGRIKRPKTNWQPELTELVEQRFQLWLAAASDEVRTLFEEAKRRHLALFTLGGSTRNATNVIGTLSTNDRLVGDDASWRARVTELERLCAEMYQVAAGIQEVPRRMVDRLAAAAAGALIPPADKKNEPGD